MRRIINKIQSSDQIQCYLLIGIPIIGFFVFTLYPILWAASKSLFFYNGAAPSTRFTGIDNFIKLFGDSGYWHAWQYTLKFTFYKLIVEIPLALVIAVLISRLKKAGGFLRGGFFTPNMISVAIVGVIFTNLFDFFGFVNGWLQKFNIPAIDWFGSTSSATTVLLMGSIWVTFGINVLYFSSAISNISDEIYEAATIDGASEVTKFFKITVPLIAPVFKIILLLAINGTLQVGEYIIAVTNGAPAGTTHTVGSYIISQFLPGFSTGSPNIGYGCAMAIVTSIIYGVIALIYMKLSKRVGEA